MSDSGSGTRHYWCMPHQRVETEETACKAADRLGPFSTAAEAERALERVQQRNAAWDAEDARWTGEQR